MNQKSKSYLTKTIVFGVLMIISFVLMVCWGIIIRAIFLPKDTPKDFFKLSSEELNGFCDLVAILSGKSKTKIKSAWWIYRVGWWVWLGLGLLFVGFFVYNLVRMITALTEGDDQETKN